MKTAFRLMIVVLGLVICVQAEDLVYITNNGTITITGYSGPGGAVTIPSEINGLPVTDIRHYAFFDLTNLTTVTIPDSVTDIGQAVFWYCLNLTNVTIGSGITSISPTTFFGCISLARVTIPPTVTSIGDGAFSYCLSLGSIDIPTSVKDIGPRAFFGCGLTNVSIGHGVTNIGERAFYDCAWLLDVTLGDSLIHIGEEAFAECRNLEYVIVGSSVNYIGRQAFAHCFGMEEICFRGPPPPLGGPDLYGLDAWVYYLPGTIGWGTSYNGRRTVPWVLPYPVILTSAPNFGRQTNAFFRISWATNAAIVVEASTSLTHLAWSPVSTNTLMGGWLDFHDAEWTNHPTRFYRVRSP